MRLAILALILFSLKALACPDLSGHYTSCTIVTTAGDLGPAPQTLTITQTLKDGITTYDSIVTYAEGAPTSMQLIADGQLRVSAGDEEEAQSSFRSYCDGDILYEQEMDAEVEKLKGVIKKVDGVYIEQVQSPEFSFTLTCN